jgi:hypothetical protein
LTGNIADLRTALSIRLSQTDLRSSLRESHSFLTLVSDTTMESSQGNHLQHPFLAIHSADERRMIYSFSNTTSNSTFDALFFFSDKIMADVARKQQTTAALFLSTIVTRTRRHTELTKKLTNLMGNLCCATEHAVQFSCSFFYTVKLHS